MDVKDENKSTGQEPINIGELLTEARNNLDLRTEDMANDLNLAIDIITKIETNEFKQDIPLAFIRGYIKSYATRVGLDTQLVLQEFDKQSGIESPSLKRVQSISKFDGKRREINSGNYLIKTISILLILLFVFFAGRALWKKYQLSDPSSEIENNSTIVLLSDNTKNDITLNLDEKNETNTNGSTAVVNSKSDAGNESEEVSSENSISPDNRISPDNNTSPTGINTTSNSDFKAETSPDIESLSASSRGTSEEIQSNPTIENLVKTNLTLIFSDDCWVEITDATGEVIAIGVKTTGKNMPLSGVAPFTVILGNPAAVEMTYEGQIVNLSEYPAGRRAKLTVK